MGRLWWFVQRGPGYDSHPGPPTREGPDRVKSAIQMWRVMIVRSRQTSTPARGRTVTTPGRSSSWGTTLTVLRSPTGIVVALYVLTLAVLVSGPGQLPGYSYNWEHYTAHDLFRFYDGDRPLGETFRLTDGLMTDGGESPFLSIPTLAIWHVLGPGLGSMRLVAMVISALSVPLVWLFARRMFDPWVAAGAAGLVLLTPGFLLYARTATTVGLSVGISIATAYVLLRVLRPEAAGRSRPIWLGAFLLLLLIGSYGYAPIRFFWPIALVAVAVECIFQPRARSWLLPTGVLIAVWMPLILTLAQGMGWTQGPASFDVAGAVSGHYRAQGEQLLEMADSPRQFGYYIAVTDEDKAGNSTRELAVRLVAKNLRDLAALVMDIDTRPALTNHWDVHGRVYNSWFMVPGVLLGLVVLATQATRRLEARFTLVMAMGFTLPLVLTSRIHVGRLIFALPFLLVIGAFGYVWLARQVALLADRRYPGAARSLWPLVPVAAGVMLLVFGRSSWQELRVAPTGSPESEIVGVLATSALAERGAGVAFVAGNRDQSGTEALDVAAYRLRLDDQFQFVNLALGERVDPEDRRTPLYYGGLVTDLAENDDGLPRPCDLTYVVRDQARQGFDQQGAAFDSCPSMPDVVRAP